MKRWLKVALIVVVVLFGLLKITEWYLEIKFQALINNNPDRAYDITYADFDLHTLFKGITLDEVKITPLTKKTTGVIVNGTVDYAELSGFKWRKFIFSKSVSINELKFVAPTFDLAIYADSTKKTKGQSMQGLFSDILSRLDLDQFQIKDGSVLMKEGDSTLIGELSRINIVASEIETDSVQLTHIIPFKLGNLEVELDSAYYQINPYTEAKLGFIDYSMTNESIILKDVSLHYYKDWVAISEERGLQDDVMEFALDSLCISNMNFSSSFWSDLDIEAERMHIDGLMLSMKRNKNLPRPPDVEKPLFKGIVDKIPFRIDLDSILISNSTVLYGELSVNKKKTGVIEITDVNGAITQLTTFPERKEEYKDFDANFTAKLNGAGNMNIALNVPYDKDSFKLHTTVGPMDMTALSRSLVPLLGVEIKEGQMKHLDYKMNASFYGSSNSLVMDYENLHLTVYKENEDGSNKKDGILSSIANAAIKHHNLPDEKRYETATYTTERNIYRSPFQHIVAGVLDGTQYIIPAKGIRALLGTNNNKKKKKKK